jgi:hypothetical protein
MWFAPESYNTCGDILTLYNLNMDKFYAWNPTVGSACTGLIAGTCYCVSTGPGGVPPPEPDRRQRRHANSNGNNNDSVNGNNYYGWIVNTDPVPSGHGVQLRPGP